MSMFSGRGTALIGDSRTRSVIALLPTVVVAGLFFVLDVRHLNFAWPAHLLVFCVAAARYAGGRLTGAVSALTAGVLVAYSYAEPGHWFNYRDIERFRVLFELALFGLALLLVGYVKSGTEARLREEALLAEIAARRREARKLDLLNQTANLVHASSDIAAARSAILRRLCEWLGAAAGRIWQPTSRDGRLACAAGWQPGSAGLATMGDGEPIPLFRLGESVPGQAWIKSVTVIAGPEDPKVMSASDDQPKPWVMATPVRRDGHVIAVAEFAFDHAPSADPSMGEVLSVVAGQLDELDRRLQAEREVLKKQRQIRSLLESTAEAIFGLDGLGRCTFANTAALKLLGADTVASLQHLDLHSIVHSTASTGGCTGSCAMSVALRTAGAAHAPADQFYRLDGSRVPVEYWCHPIADGQDEDHFVVTAIDVSERQRIEDKLRQAQRMESLGNLAGGIAHDFNNLLTVMIGSASLLNFDADDPQRQYVANIAMAAERAADLTKQLLAFSRRQLLELQDLDLVEIVADTTRLLQRLIPENIVLTTSTAHKASFVRADVGQLQQVIMNLVVNARDAMPAGGRLTIETTHVDVAESDIPPPAGIPVGPYVLLTISDTGIGMDRDTLTHIFEPFFTTKGIGAGTGLGLATVYGVVSQIGGHVRAYSEPGQGTTFKVYFPRVAAQALRRDSSTASESVTGRGESILLAEDNPLVRQLTARILGELGYVVVAAESGAQALAAAAASTKPFDLLLTDMIMPDMNGRELLAALAARGITPKVIFMSGYAKDALLEGPSLPPDAGIIQKPFSPKMLAMKVREILDGRAARDA